MLRTCMNTIVQGKFRVAKTGIPIILTRTYVTTYNLFNGTVKPLSLTIGVRVVR